MPNRRRGEWDLWNIALGAVLLVTYTAIVAMWLTPDATFARWFIRIGAWFTR